MTARKGLCCGGPLDGQSRPLHEKVRTFEVFTLDSSRGLRKVRLGHYEFLVGFWIWKPDATSERPNA